MVAKQRKPHEPASKAASKAIRRSKPRLTLEKSAGVVVFRRGAVPEYLLILSSYWEFPKGQVEPDESEAEAAIREVREETGLEVTLLPGFRQHVDYFYRRGGDLIKKQVVYFLGEAANGNVRVSWEHQQAEWLAFEGALARLKYENVHRILTKANEFLNKRPMENR